MENRVQLDLLIKKSLADKAESVKIPDNMPETVIERINSDMKKGRLHRIINEVSLYRMTGRQVAAAVFAGVTTISVLFNFNPQARVWAEKTASEVKKNIIITFYKGNAIYSKSIEKTVEVGEETRVIGIGGQLNLRGRPTVDIKDMESKAGFKVKLPKYLPSGYKIPDKVDVSYVTYVVNSTGIDDSWPEDCLEISKPRNHSQELVTINLNNANDQAEGVCTLYVADNEFFSLYEEEGEPINISNITATLYHEAVTLKNDEQSEGREASMNILQWKDENVFYKLIDCTGISVDELKKIAESIIREP
jgi:hypothetical protein